MAACAVGGDGASRGIGPDACGMTVVVAAEIGRVTEGAVAGTVGRRAITVDAGDFRPGDRRVAEVTGAGGTVAMDSGNDVASMAAGAGRAAGYPIMILDQVVFVASGVG